MSGRSISRTRGAAYLDLSVIHDNEQAIALYEKLGFMRWLPTFTVKRKNVINERLFTEISVTTTAALNPYARIIVDEACGAAASASTSSTPKAASSA